MNKGVIRRIGQKAKTAYRVCGSETEQAIVLLPQENASVTPQGHAARLCAELAPAEKIDRVLSDQYL